MENSTEKHSNLSIFANLLIEEGLLENTILIITGDHRSNVPLTLKESPSKFYIIDGTNYNSQEERSCHIKSNFNLACTNPPKNINDIELEIKKDMTFQMFYENKMRQCFN